MREHGTDNSFPACLKGEAWKLCAQGYEPKTTKITVVATHVFSCCYDTQ